MASSDESSGGADELELELGLALDRPARPRPGRLDELCRQTRFTRQEIRLMYRGFKQECPEGIVYEETFKDIYAKFFPYGNANAYAHYVFKAFDVNSNGTISFRDMLTTLSTLLRGSTSDKLRWAFRLYDLNGDGCITRTELHEIVVAVHELMGSTKHPSEDKRTRDQVERVFRKLDRNQDGIITIEEFMDTCLKDDMVTHSLQNIDPAI